jgi:O-methyltransferase
LRVWFNDTLPDAPIDRLAVLRLDGDMYESTIEALNALYHKVSYGGFVIVDDYFLPPCAKAVTDFRERYGTTTPITPD